MENKEIYYTRVLPIVKYVETFENGEFKHVCKDNLSQEELKSLSLSSARMLWESNEELYIAEMPLTYNQGTSVKFSIVFLFDELSENDQEKYFDRTIILPLTRKSTVKVYGENSKRVFSKKKVKSKEEK